MAYRGALGLAALAMAIGGVIMLWQRVPESAQCGLKATLGVIVSLLLLLTLLSNLTRCADYFTR